MIEVIVRDCIPETADVRRLVLTTPDGSPLPAFEAGAHIDVHLPNGMTRQYSLFSDPAQRDAYHIGVLKDKASRGGSQWIHDALMPGARLRISPPRNLFPLAKQAKRHLLFAGGIGITPILSMARHLSGAGEAFELFYSVRSADYAAFAPDAATWAGPDRFHLITDAPEAALQRFAPVLAAPDDDTHLYVCGPAGYIDAILTLARQSGWTEGQLHKESFGALPSTGADGAFTVQLARSGKTIEVAPDQTVIKALLDNGIIIPYSCEQGVCGTCLTPVLSGTPDHRDQYLTDEERAANDQFTPCCSRALTPELVLDL